MAKDSNKSKVPKEKAVKSKKKIKASKKKPSKLKRFFKYFFLFENQWLILLFLFRLLIVVTW